MGKLRLGDLLLTTGNITQEQLDRALERQKTEGGKLGGLLVDDGVITGDTLAQILEFQLGVPYVDLARFDIDPEVATSIPVELAETRMVLPLALKNDILLLAMADPTDHNTVQDVALITKYEVSPIIVTDEAIKKAINVIYKGARTKAAIEEFKSSIVEASEENGANADIESEKVKKSPLVKLVNSIILQAIKASASDIHIEPLEYSVRVRIRVDGVLQEISRPSKAIHTALVTRIKIMGKMDIAETRVPQDGKAFVEIEDSSIDLRISTLPTIYGEKVVLRLLSKSESILSKEELGFTHENLKKFNKLLSKPDGIILVTGPTGSGKTTSLYAALKELNTKDKNIITVEDPVEYRLEGITQVQLNLKAGLNFANSLKAILRQDPDIIMVGEIRDKEAGEIAIRASITGHVVLSTMHTNDTVSTLSRLTDMGIEPFLISAALKGVLAQRLVRRICPYCKEKNEQEGISNLLKTLGVPVDFDVYRGAGCKQCGGSGYKGRIAVHEILMITAGIRHLIDTGALAQDIKDKAVEEGMSTLADSGLRLLKEGVISLSEVMKLLHSFNE